MGFIEATVASPAMLAMYGLIRRLKSGTAHLLSPFQTAL